MAHDVVTSGRVRSLRAPAPRRAPAVPSGSSQPVDAVASIVTDRPWEPSRVAAPSRHAVLDGVWLSCLNVDGRSAIGWLALCGNNGTGSDGKHQFELHVHGRGHDMTGIINVFIDAELAGAMRLPHHFSLAMIGSGSDRSFNLIGSGPRGILVEIDAGWREPLAQ